LESEFTMRKMLLSALMLGAAVTVQAANAATFIEAQNVIDNKVHAFSDPAYPSTGTSVYGKTTNEGELVKFSSTDVLDITTGSGYASVTENMGVSNWDNLNIQLANYAFGFTGLEFGIQFVNDDVKQDPGTLQLTAYFLDPLLSPQIFSIGGIKNGSNNTFVLQAEGSEVFKYVTLTGAPDRFFQLKQSDILLATAPIPEPATWAMMILGLGAVGATMRRRKLTSKVSFA